MNAEDALKPSELLNRCMPQVIKAIAESIEEDLLSVFDRYEDLYDSEEENTLP